MWRDHVTAPRTPWPVSFWRPAFPTHRCKSPPQAALDESHIGHESDIDPTEGSEAMRELREAVHQLDPTGDDIVAVGAEALAMTLEKYRD